MIGFPLWCTTNLSHDLLLTFLFLSFPFLPFPSFLHLPTLSFSKLLATSQIKSLGFWPEFCFLKVYPSSSFVFVFWKQQFQITVLSILFRVSFHMFFLCVENSFFMFCFLGSWSWFLANSHDCDSGICESWLFSHLFVFCFLVFFFFEKVCLLFCELSIKIGNHFSILVLCFEPRRSSFFGLVLSEEILLGRFLCASDPCSHTSTP